MAALALWAIVGLALALALATYGELRRLRGAWVACASSVCAALAQAPMLHGSQAGARTATALSSGAALLLLGALALLYRDLLARRWLMAALYDIESGLPNRAQWESWLVRYPEPQWQAVRVSFSDISSTRRLEAEQVEKAFFNWLGQQLIDRQAQLPGYVARLSLRDIGFLVPAADGDAVLRVERVLNQLGTSLRSGGFEARHSVRPSRRAEAATRANP